MGERVCEGSCELHRGEVRRCQVVDVGRGRDFDWGHYDYCDEAQEEDIRRGFSVVILEDPHD